MEQSLAFDLPTGHLGVCPVGQKLQPAMGNGAWLCGED